MKLKSLFSQYSYPEPQLQRAQLPAISSASASGFSLLSPVSQYIPSLFNNSAYLTERNLIGLPAAGYCLGLYTGGIGQMLRHAHVVDENGKRLPTPTIVATPYVRYPGATEFWEEVIATLLIHGNYFALVVARDDDGFPLQLFPIHPCNVSVEIRKGEVYYKVGDVEYAYGDKNLFHIRRMNMPNSILGIGVLAQFMEALKTQAYEQTYAQKSIQAGGPSHIVELDTPNMPGQDELDRIKLGFVSKFAYGSREPIVLPKTIKIQPANWSPMEMDFLNRQNFSVGEMAFMWQLNPAELGASFGTGNSTVYSNIEQHQIARHIDSYGSVLHRIEDAYSSLLPEGQYLQGSPDSLLKMDTATRNASVQMNAGILTVNERRKLQGYEPIDGGDVISAIGGGTADVA